MNAVEPVPEEPVKLEGFGPQDLYQRREKIFTRYVGGFFQKLRFYSGWPLLLGYFATPWLMWGERQAVLLDLPARQFHLLGLTIWPQDLWLLGWLLMIAAFGLFTITTLVGRLWCGYTCPQTIWTSVFMWVEQITEGPRHQRIRLDKAPWSLNKLRRRTAKHTLWLGWAFLTGVTFVGYFTPIRELTTSAVHMDIPGWAAFWAFFFTAATYVNAGWMREQVCTYMCPYARFQSAMIDKDTLIVSYDAARGEPRGSTKRGSIKRGSASKQDADKSQSGDCIDCQLCVQVCPTGIDIRDGLQYECIGCAHCIDACNQVMNKVGSEPGLVRYTTETALAGKAGEPIKWLHGRSIGYASVCLLLSGAFAGMLLTREGFAFDVLRERGQLFQQTANGTVRNDYQLKIMNKTQGESSYSISVDSPSWVDLASSNTITVEPGNIENLSLMLTSNQPVSGSSPVDLSVCNLADDSCIQERTTFFAPSSNPPGSGS